MCIICSTNNDPAKGTQINESGFEFLYLFQHSRSSMKKACEAMLQCSKDCKEPSQSRHYDKMHKKMKHIYSDWCEIEGQREHPNPLTPLVTYDKI